MVGTTISHYKVAEKLGQGHTGQLVSMINLLSPIVGGVKL